MEYGVRITSGSYHGGIQGRMDALGISWSRERVPDGRLLYRVGGRVLTPGEADTVSRGGQFPAKPSGACHCWSAVIHVGMHDGHCCFREDAPCHSDPRA